MKCGSVRVCWVPDPFVRTNLTEEMADGDQKRWADYAKRVLKAELQMADVGYAELARRLTAMGLPETEGSITVKINRGTYPAWFLFATLRAIGAKAVRVIEGSEG